MRGAGLLNPHSTNIQAAAPTQMLGHSGKPGEQSLKQWCALPWRQRGNRDGSPPRTARQKLLLTLCSVQRKNALPFLNLLGSCTVPACPGGNPQETTEAPTMESHQSPTHRKLKHIIKSKESKSPADGDNPLSPGQPTRRCACRVTAVLAPPACRGAPVTLKPETEEKTSSSPFSSAQSISSNTRSSKGKTVQDWPPEGSV